jgi:hypothetical protein
MQNVKICDAVVVSVDEVARTCVVNSLDSSIDGLTVRLMLETSDGDYEVPSVDSTITVAYSDNTIPYMVKATWIDKKIVISGDTEISLQDKNVTVSQGTNIISVVNGVITASTSAGNVVKLDSNGLIQLSNNNQNLKTILDSILNNTNSILSAIQELTVICAAPTNPSSIPINATVFATIATQISQNITQLSQLLE